MTCKPLSSRVARCHREHKMRTPTTGPDGGDLRRSPKAAEALKLLVQISIAAQSTTIRSRR